jgi:prevent-host-death family protein
MAIVTIREAKSNLSQLIKKASAGEEIIIVRGDKPVARLIPVVAQRKGKRRPGSLQGELCVGPEFFEPLPAAELNSWE